MRKLQLNIERPSYYTNILKLPQKKYKVHSRRKQDSTILDN